MNNTPRPIRDDIDAKIIENIEDLPLLTTVDHWYALLVYLKVKPAAWLIVSSDAWRDGEPPKQVCQNSLDTITNTFDAAGVMYRCSFRETDAGLDQHDGSRTRLNQLADIYIGVDNDAVAELASACEVMDHRRIGLALGYPVTAVQAFDDGSRVRMTELDYQVQFSEAGQLTNFIFSRASWQNELKLVEHWVEALKKYSPIIYRRQDILPPHITEAIIAHQKAKAAA